MQGTYIKMDTYNFAQYIANPEVLLIDVRTPEEYAEGHLPSARLCDVKRADFSECIAQLVPSKQQAVALYCRSGARSQAALDYMRSMGYTQVVHLDGGILGWHGEVTTK